MIEKIIRAHGLGKLFEKRFHAIDAHGKCICYCTRIGTVLPRSEVEKVAGNRFRLSIQNQATGQSQRLTIDNDPMEVVSEKQIHPGIFFIAHHEGLEILYLVISKEKKPERNKSKRGKPGKPGKYFC